MGHLCKVMLTITQPSYNLCIEWYIEKSSGWLSTKAVSGISGGQNMFIGTVSSKTLLPCVLQA